MTDLSLDEKIDGAVDRAKLREAEKHFFDAAQPFFPLGFSVGWRNPGHWDVFAQSCPGEASAWKYAHPEGRTSLKDGQSERAFRIRGEVPDVVVIDERWDPHRPHPRETLKFRSVLGAMLWITEELMREPSK
jgi:hypothetical protein